MIDYNSTKEMVSSIWGPPLWHFLHTISVNYPINPTLKDKKNYYNFFYNLQYVLPCDICRKNLKKNYKYTLPLSLNTFESREILSKYVYDLHELINKSHHKKSNLTFDDVRKKYEYFRVR